jgi:hypothetical protein
MQIIGPWLFVWLSCVALFFFTLLLLFIGRHFSPCHFMPFSLPRILGRGACTQRAIKNHGDKKSLKIMQLIKYQF